MPDWRQESKCRVTELGIVYQETPEHGVKKENTETRFRVLICGLFAKVGYIFNRKSIQI